MRAVALMICLLFVACRPADQLRARLQLKEGNRAYLSADYRAAIAHYERALDYVPDHAEAHRNCSYSLMALLRMSGTSEERSQLADRAIKMLERLEELESRDQDQRMPNRDQIDQYVLTLLLDSQQQDKALVHLEKRLQRRPRDVATMMMMSDICMDIGKIDRAISLREKCLEFEPDRAEAHYAMGVFAWRASYYDQIAGEDRAQLIDRGLHALVRARELRKVYPEALTYTNLLYREKARIAPSAEERRRYLALAEKSENLALKLFESSRQNLDSLEIQTPDVNDGH